MESAIARRYLEHVTQLSLVKDGLGSRVGRYFRDVGTRALQSQSFTVCPSLMGYW